MSKQLSFDKIKSHPKYAELISKRSHLAWSLAALMLIIYYGFILVIAFAPQFLATPLSAGSVTTIGLPIGVGVILSAIVLTGIYVYRANTEFDELTRDLIEEAK
jgi:uncharacterized membrane protein (DUF485 family)